MKLLVLSLLGFLSFIVLDWLKPLPIEDFKERSFAQLVVDKNGLPLRSYPDKQGVWRYPVTIDEVSPLYLEALIEYEDRYFYQHFGVNPLAVVRAMGQGIRNGRIVSGASTLTMQVARILEPHERTFGGKLWQMFRAMQLEWHYSKEQILTYYLNYAPFGGPIEGIQAASYAYLGKPAMQLTHSEAALLAVLPQRPSTYRPDRNPKIARKARDKVIKRLEGFAVWDQLAVKEALEESIWANFEARPMNAPLLSRKLIQQQPDESLIQTTLDRAIQVPLERLTKNYIQSKGSKMSAAVLVINNKTTSSLAYVGSADFANKDRFGYVDMVKATRSPGSTLKPFIYGMAIDEGLIHSESLLFDVPQSFAGYEPKNFTDKFSGPVSTSQALVRSLNMPAVQVLEAYSPEKFYSNLQNAGVKISLPVNSKPNLSIALGGGGLNLEQLVTLYASLANQGKIKSIEHTAASGDKAASSKLLSEGSAWIIQNILKAASLDSNINRGSLKKKRSIAFKTGTSYGFRDAWAIAVTDVLTVGVWIGRPDGSYNLENSGRQGAVPLLGRVLSLFPDLQKHSPAKPLNVETRSVCWPLGTLATLQEDKDCQQKRTAQLLDGTAPMTLSDRLSHDWNGGKVSFLFDEKLQKRVLPECSSEQAISKSVALWPKTLEPWLAAAYRRDSLLPPLAKECQNSQSLNKLELIGIKGGAKLFSPSGETKLPKINMELIGANGRSYWFLDGRQVQAESGDSMSKHHFELTGLSIGKHNLKVIDDSGSFVELAFSVVN